MSMVVLEEKRATVKINNLEVTPTSSGLIRLVDTDYAEFNIIVLTKEEAIALVEAINLLVPTDKEKTDE